MSSSDKGDSEEGRMTPEGSANGIDSGVEDATGGSSAGAHDDAGADSRAPVRRDGGGRRQGGHSQGSGGRWRCAATASAGRPCAWRVAAWAELVAAAGVGGPLDRFAAALVLVVLVVVVLLVVVVGGGEEKDCDQRRLAVLSRALEDAGAAVAAPAPGPPRRRACGTRTPCTPRARALADAALPPISPHRLRTTTRPTRPSAGESPPLR